MPLALTWMATVQLTDDASQRRPVLVLALLTVVTAALIPFWPAMTPIRGILAIALYLGLIILALATDSDDLVIDRRRFRRGFLVAMGALGLIVSVVEASGLDANLPNWIYPLQASAILVLALLFAIWALEPVADEPIKRTVSKSRADLTERVEQVMRRGIWQREGLTIGAFAEELGVPEHQLRATINGEMGHRNFSTFINVARIKAAKELMNDPSRGRTTILEIAHEVGFASLGPFNKAFRAQTGSSPREYRNRD
ncbi:AraC family transcriptional regulator [Roseibium sp. RKSG952]|uniref:helix-turn-helix domain-containing protein n=1 Tax=Roseibium sp. RKSG952 TaxID=2529384 RepID=UPI0018AD271D|nr:AraC family transcriptional regulator [Roseibium sp. RKSG952]